jgi:glycyl-tRNA synthetase beta chain
MGTLLFEIGTEEIPAGYIAPALTQLEEKLSARLRQLNIGFGTIRTLATPKRLALIVESIDEKQADIREELVGPSVQSGFDAQGNPTKAAVGFAKSKGATPDDLKVVKTDKGEYLMLVREQQGQNVLELLPEILQQLIGAISFPKSMRWGSNDLSFARPIQWLLAKFNDTTINLGYEGITASNVSRGHRFLNNHEIEIDNGNTYENQLATVNVIVDQTKRKADVLATIKNALAESDFAGKGELYIDEDLLDIVTNLVEKPFGICGRFNEKFLELPDEVLITSMKVNQKYFPIVDKKGELLAGFVAVNNTKTDNEAITRQGHERVLRARLEDALFFYKSDQGRKLEDLVPELNGSIFQAQLGTMFEKNERLVKLTRMFAEMLEPDLIDDACRAALLCKTDLLTDMVGEFPSLQGIMGQSYAALSGEKQEVALAIREHYMPRRAGAELPTQPLGALVGMADRLDTLVGCFGIQQVPTGTADPFGLRRISLAILHIVGEYKYRFSLREVVLKALALYGNKVDGSSATVEAVISFVKERYRNDCIAKGLDSEAVAAVTSVAFDDIIDSTLRIEALSKLKTNASFSVLASSFKRVKNITKDNQEKEVKEDLLIENAEKDLYTLLKDVRQHMQPMCAERNYFGALEYFLKLKEPVDTFFDEVMVMADDAAIRQNRLNLLTALSELVLNIGDISKMQEG